MEIIKTLDTMDFKKNKLSNTFKMRIYGMTDMNKFAATMLSDTTADNVILDNNETA